MCAIIRGNRYSRSRDHVPFARITLSFLLTFFDVARDNYSFEMIIRCHERRIRSHYSFLHLLNASQRFQRSRGTLEKTILLPRQRRVGWE